MGIDTANQHKHYWEAHVGDALQDVWKNGTLKREDFFLQTKFTFERGQDNIIPYDTKADYDEQVRSYVLEKVLYV